MRSLAQIPVTELRALRRSIERDRVDAPLSRLGLQGDGYGAQAEALLSALGGLDRGALLAALELVIAERERPQPTIDLVWTGPETRSSTARDTAVVLRELFAGAHTSVLIAGYRFDHGEELFEPLHRAMAERELQVRIITDIHRRARDPADPRACAAAFFARFFRYQWPWEGARPELFYDPRTAELGPVHEGVSLHAKVAVVDERKALIGSANFTSRAQTRNIEAGALIDDPRFASGLIAHFQGLVNAGHLIRAPAT